MGINVKRPVYKVLTQADSFPYTPPEGVQLTGIAIVNDGNDTVTVVINNGEENVTVNCTINSRPYDADFKAIKSINVTAGTTYQIELRRI